MSVTTDEKIAKYFANDGKVYEAKSRNPSYYLKQYRGLQKMSS